MTPFFFFFTSAGGSVTQTVTVQAQASLTGVSLRLRSRSTGAVVDTEVAAETASGSSVYTADFTDVPAGTYFVQLIRDSDGAILRYSDATLTLTTATFPVSGSGGVAELNTAGQAMVTAFNAMRVGNVFTAPALANAPTGSGGGGSNAEVLAAIDSMKSIIAQWVALNIPSDVRGFPATIIGGTDVTVTLEVVDSNNDPITEIFGESVETVQWLFGMGTSARRARILGSVEWISDLLQITITRAETLDDDDGPRTWMIGCKLTSGEVKWVKTGVTRLIGRQFAEPTTTTTGA